MQVITWLVGLGNPGTGYQYHRHNIGFRLVEAIQLAGDFTPWRAERQQLASSQGQLAGHKLRLIKPMTYMNLSGQVVQGALARGREKITPAQILVLHDEIDLEFGRVKIKWGGGHGGHNGVRDLAARLGPDFGRLRFGVGHPGHRDLVSDFVLQNFSTDEEKQLQRLISLVVKHLPILLADGPESFLQQWSAQANNTPSSQSP